MSTSTTPVSTVVTTTKPNGFEKFFETVGHDLKVVFTAGEKVIANLPKYIKAVEDGGQDAQALIPLVQDVIAKSMAFAKPAAAIGAAVAGSGTNIAADSAAISALLSSMPSLQSDLQAFYASIKALAEAVGVDWKQLSADLGVAATTN